MGVSPSIGEWFRDQEKINRNQESRLAELGLDVAKAGRCLDGVEARLRWLDRRLDRVFRWLAGDLRGDEDLPALLVTMQKRIQRNYEDLCSHDRDLARSVKHLREEIDKHLRAHRAGSTSDIKKRLTRVEMALDQHTTLGPHPHHHHHRGPITCGSCRTTNTYCTGCGQKL